MYMRGVFFYTIAIAFVSGIFIRSFFIFEYTSLALVSLIGFALIVAGLIRYANKKSVPLFLIGIACLCFSLGVLRFHIVDTAPNILAEREGENVSLTARIVKEPEARATTMHIYAEPEAYKDETILITTDIFAHFESQFSYGDIIEVQGTLKKPEPFEGDGGRIFDYVGYLKARDVHYMMSFASVNVLEQEEGTFLGALFRTKQRFIETLEVVMPEPHAGLGEGLLLGVKRAIGEELEGVFRDTGVIHIVVLSGYNIMIVVECIMLVLSFFLFPRMRMLIGLITIGLFALLVGLTATVVRASVMAGLFIVARATGKTYAILRALMLAGIGMLILNPYLLVHDPGFQLSFLATLGLILIAPQMEKYMTLIPGTLGVRGFVTATLATQLFVLPLLLFQMGTLSIVAVLVNALVLPMVSLAMLLTFLTGIIGMFSHTVGMGVGYLAYLSLSYIIFIPEFFARLPFASFQVSAFPFWIVLIAYGVIALMVYYSKRPSRDRDITTIVNDYEDWTIVEEKKLLS